MKQFNFFKAKNCWLIVTICSSLLIGLPMIARAQQDSFSNPNRVNQSPTSTGQSAQPPLPSQQQSPIFQIAPVNGQVNIRLMNDTVAPVTYQVLGDTAPRTLSGKTEVMLTALKTPVTVTFYRQDGGLLSVDPQLASETDGMLQVRLQETTDLGSDKNALIVERTGNIFLN